MRATAFAAVERRGRVEARGTDGAGAAAGDRFFAELDPPEQAAADSAEIQAETPAAQQTEQKVGERASKLVAISMDMGEGYAKSAREHAPRR